MKYLLILLLVLQGCSLFRSTTEGTSNKNINTVTKEVEVREEIHGDQKVALKTTRYKETVSKEQAQYESRSSHSSPLLTSIGTGAGGLLGLGPVADMVLSVAGAAGAVKAKRAAVSWYNNTRDAPPRSPQPRAEKVTRKEEEEDAN